MLSYAASFGIAVFTRPVLRICAACMPRRIADTAAVSVAAQICALPVCARIFGVIPLAAVPASVCISPLISLFMTVGLAGLIACMIMPFLLQPLGVIISAIYNAIAVIVCIFAGIPQIVIDS